MTRKKPIYVPDSDSDKEESTATWKSTHDTGETKPKVAKKESSESSSDSDSEYQPPNYKPLVTEPKGVLESAQMSEKEEKNPFLELSDNPLSDITDQGENQAVQQPVQQQPNQEEESSDQFAMSPLDNQAEQQVDQQPVQQQVQVQQQPVQQPIQQPRVDASTQSKKPTFSIKSYYGASVQPNGFFTEARNEFTVKKIKGEQFLISKRKVNLDWITEEINTDPLSCDIGVLYELLEVVKEKKPNTKSHQDVILLLQHRLGKTRPIKPFSYEEIKRMYKLRDEIGYKYKIMARRMSRTETECRLFWLQYDHAIMPEYEYE